MFCEWVAEGDTVRYDHIRLRSALGEYPERQEQPNVMPTNETARAAISTNPGGCCGGNPYDYLI